LEISKSVQTALLLGALFFGLIAVFTPNYYHWSQRRYIDKLMSDVTPWRVTDDNPTLDNSELDYERCTALHNVVLEIGCLQAEKISRNLIAKVGGSFMEKLLRLS